MANKKISDLDRDTTVSIADYVPIVVSGSNATKKARVSDVLALGSGSAGTTHFVGKFASLTDLRSSVPVGNDGDYATVTDGDHAVQYIWDSNLNNWVSPVIAPAVNFASLTGSPADNDALSSLLNGLSSADATEAAARANADSALQSNIDLKVDKDGVKVLSDNNYTTGEKAKLASLVDRFKGKYASLAQLQTALPTANDGDYVIVSGSPNDQEYIWDSDHSTWVLTENIPASTFASLSGSPSDNAALNTVLTQESSDRISGDTNLQTQVSALSAALIPHPTYTAPTANISSSQTTSGLEIGQTINIPLTATFNQNDGGSNTGLSIKKNGAQIATASPYTDSGIVLSATAVSYQVNYTYGQGPVKNNIIGVPDATGRISSGNVNSNTLSYQGFYRVWYDTVAAFPTDSATVRALSNTRFSNSGNTFTLNTGSVNTKFCIVLPPGKTLVSVVDQDALNLDITSQYVQSSITVNDAAGAAVSTYKIYAMSQSVPYSTSHRHNITIA